MQNSYFIVPFLLFVSNAFAQPVSWAVNIDANKKPHGMICDRQGNVYLYGGDRSGYWTGNVYQDSPSENKGSFISKYSPNGDLLLNKSWDSPLFIHQMIYDGNNHFYFTGSVAGQVSLSGKNVSSRGNYDGVVGKMNEKGEMIWLTSFGGPKNDLGNSLTFDSKKQSLIVTGGVSDTFYVNNNLVTVAPQRSILLAKFSLNGELLDQRLIDFLATKNYNNCGFEIVTAASGNYFLLGEQEGKSWDGDTTNAPADGKYIYKIDPSFNILWSKFIINNECYYGYQCAKMSCLNDDVYVPKFCSSKYGGEGAMMRLDNTNGTTGWTLENKDGNYSDTYSDGSSLFFVGTEGASICPCPENDFGHQVVKKVDAANNEELILTLYNCFLNNITCNNTGMTFVSGNSYEPLHIGSYHLQGGNFLFAIGQPAQLTTGTDEQSIGLFNLFPNPSDGKVEITFSAVLTQESVLIRVVDLVGQEIFTETIRSNNDGHYSLNIGDRVKGSYLVEITSGELKQVRHLIIR